MILVSVEHLGSEVGHAFLVVLNQGDAVEHARRVLGQECEDFLKILDKISSKRCEMKRFLNGVHSNRNETHILLLLTHILPLVLEKLLLNAFHGLLENLLPFLNVAGSHGADW